jgi:hypothetical protein
MKKTKEKSPADLHKEYLKKLQSGKKTVRGVEQEIIDLEKKQEYESCKALKEAIEDFKDSQDNVSFDFSCLEILGAFGNDIYVKGSLYPNDGDGIDFRYYDSDCVVAIDRDLFHKAFILWLDRKKDLCELWGHFCGVWEHIDADEYEELNSYKIMDEVKIEAEEWKDYLKTVRAFKIISFNENLDMAHG